MDQDIRLITDLRRHVAFVGQGAMRMLVVVQSCLEDVDGALAAGQLETAALAARAIVLNCLAIRGIARGGEVGWAQDTLSFDAFAFATPTEVDEAVALMNGGASLAEGDRTAWREALGRLVDDVERDLGFDEGIPTLRSPEGMFGAIRMARGLFELVDKLALPPVLPDDWADPARQAAGKQR